MQQLKGHAFLQASDDTMGPKQATVRDGSPQHSPVEDEAQPGGESCTRPSYMGTHAVLKPDVFCEHCLAAVVTFTKYQAVS